MTHSRHTLNIFALVMPSRIETVAKQRKRQKEKVKRLERELHEANARAIGLDAELDELGYAEPDPQMQA